MASSTANSTNIINSDIYKVSDFVDQLKAKYIDVPEETMYLGIYGYLSSIFSNLIQNTATIVADYANEAIPTKAKFERNIISHALSLGINNIFAQPAEIDVFLAFSESALSNNMASVTDTSGTITNIVNKIVIDKDAVFYIGTDKQYPYILDYDIIIKRILSSDGSTYSYTAQYDIDKYNSNVLSNIVNPYLPALGKIKIENETLISLRLTLRQMYHSTITKEIIVDNPFETKTLTFEFDDQLAYFYVLVTDKSSTEIVDEEENSKEIYLEPVYEGVSDYSSNNKFINYSFIDEKTIRLKFNRYSYEPKSNVSVTVHIYTTLGSECNFTLSNTYQIIQNLVSSKYSYNALYYVLRSTSDSQYGRDRYSIDKLKQFIPKEALARGSITTYTDLNNYFNTIQTDDCKLYLLQKIHNQIERLFYCYLLMKSNNNVVPTNTINIEFKRSDFYSTSQNNFIILPDQPIFQSLTSSKDTASIVTLSNEYQDTIEYEDKGFLYTNPLMIVINKNPFYVSYFNINVNYTRQLYFEYVNERSTLQFVAMQFSVFREKNLITEENEFHIEMEFSQNIDIDYDLVSYSADQEIDSCLVSVYALLYYQSSSEGDTIEPFRYIEGTIKNYNQSTGVYTFDFCLTTNYRVAKKNTYMHFNTGLREIGTGLMLPSYLYKTMKVKFFFAVKLDKKYGSTFMNEENSLRDLNQYIPDLQGYTLTNIYTAGDLGVDLYYDYSNVMNSYIELSRASDEEMLFTIYRVPVVRYSWWNYLEIESAESAKTLRQVDFFKLLDYRRKYIENALDVLEDSFGIDFKFYNTYGKSNTYNIDNTTNIDRVNLTLKFEIKFLTKEDQIMLPSITRSIKEYIENIDNVDDLHMPNLITEIKNKYESNLIYIKFIELNSYPSLWQSIYKNPEMGQNEFVESQTVPEFINVNTTIEGEPDIQYVIV